MKIFAALAMVLVASQAQALSCVTPDVARSYNEAATAKISYMIVRGALNRGNPTVQKSDPANATPVSQRFPAHIRGAALTEQGFKGLVDTNLTLELGCTGPTCAALPDNGNVLALIELTDNGPILRLNACGGHLFAAPTKEQLNKMESCAAGGCAPQ